MQCLKKAILLTCGVLLLLTSYPQEVLIDCALNNYTEKYKVVDKKYKSENDYLIIDVIIPVIENNEGNPNIEKLNNKIIKWTEDWINDVKKISDEYFKGLVPPPIGPYQLYSRYKVTNSQNITSFYIDYYQFTGGAHGITTRLSYSVDNKTGKVFGVLEWIKNTNMVLTACTEEDVLRNIPQALNLKECEYDRNILKKEFDKMSEKIKEVIEKNEN